MQVILLTDIEKLGYRFDVVQVKPGYGRNYLIPQGFAQIANRDNLARLDDIKAKEAEVEAARIAEFQAQISKLESKALSIGAKAGTSGKIFGSVTNVQIAAAIKDTFDMDIERKKIDMPEDIKELGSYVAEIRLYKNMVLFRYYIEAYFSHHIFVKANLCHVRSEFFDIFRHIDFFALDIHIKGVFDSSCDLHVGNATEYFSAGTSFCANGKSLRFQLADLSLELGDTRCFYFCFLGFDIVQASQIIPIGDLRESLRNQVITPITRLDLYNVEAVAKFFNIC